LLSKSFYYLLVVLFVSINNTPLIYAQISEKKNNQTNLLEVDYLKKLPDFNYIIGPGDTIQIIVSRDYPELTTMATVDGEGTIYIPKLNRIFVKDLAVNELNEILNEAYKKFIKYPDVEIQIKTYRPVRVFVEGEVVSPGMKTLSGSIALGNRMELDLFDNVPGKQMTTPNQNLRNYFFPTVFDAIRKSGGITQFSDLSNVQVIRKNNLGNGGGQITTYLNFKDLLTVGDGGQNIRIYDADIIKINKTNKVDNNVLKKAALSNLNPKFLNVSVYGRVNAPGNITVARSGVLTDAIDIAGGTRALKGPLTYIKFNNDGTIEKRKFTFRSNAKRGSFKNPYLSDGDLIVVGNSAWNITSEVITQITNPFRGLITTYALVKTLSD